MHIRNLSILVLCQFISTSGSIVMVMLGGIIGAQLTSNDAFATLPMSMMVVAVAASTIPATMLMRRIGRRVAFALASASAAVAMLVAIVALRAESFVIFIGAAMLFGVNLAFSQQYRYAAVENVAQKYVARAVSLVLVGSIGAAFAGREIATRGQFLVDSVPYVGTMLILAVLFVIQAFLFLIMQPGNRNEDDDPDEQMRPLPVIVRQPLFLAAVLGGTVGYGLMTLVMTATPLSMHINDGYSLDETAKVIQAHVLAMYVPSLFTGIIIERIGVIRVMLIGALGMLAVTAIGLQGHSVMHYWWALVLLGVGWNFLYIGGTTLLTYTYRNAERFRAQAVNEFAVFGMSATASLLAGTVMHYFGWATLMLIPIPVLLAVSLVLLTMRNNPQLLRPN